MIHDWTQAAGLFLFRPIGTYLTSRQAKFREQNQTFPTLTIRTVTRFDAKRFPRGKSPVSEHAVLIGTFMSFGQRRL